MEDRLADRRERRTGGRGAVIPDEEINELFAVPSPCATLYLGLSDQMDGIAADRAVRWRRLRDSLAADGADGATLGALDEVVASLGPQNAALAACAADGRVVWCHRLRRQVADRAVWGSLPCTLPMLAYRQSSVPCVVVLTDRTGADLRVAGDGLRFAGEVVGSDDEIERNAPGGWSQRRYQDRAEDSWDHNAAQVAEAVTELTERVDAALVVLAGDVRAVQLLRKHLPPRVTPLVHQLEHGGRHPGRSDRFHSQEVRELVEAEVRDRTRAVLDRFAEDRAHGRAVDGVPATLAALVRAQVGTLLVVDDPGDDRAAWYGPEPGDVATEPGALARLARRAGSPPTTGRLADLAVRAAWGTGAAVRVLPADLPGAPTDGLGALLRYPSP
nr:Vms1/Ankzf1 family peptidyl-tRNA hydrolase [Frankia casuarinae]